MIDVPILVKDSLKDGRRLKNYKILVLNDDGTTDFVIENDTLVKESVNIDERMCSGETIKFGLCEGSSFQFQYFNHPNITGRQINVFCEAQYKDTDGTLKWYSIPMGFFTVKNCSRQASTGIIKVTAYNKLMSEYLDRKANELIQAAYEDLETDPYISNVTIDLILRDALGAYAIDNTQPVSWAIRYDAALTVAVFTYEETAFLTEAFNIGSGVCAYVTDQSMMETPSPQGSTLKGYTRVKISGINALKGRLIDIFGQAMYEAHVTDSIFYFTMSPDAGSPYTLGLMSYTEDEFTTPIIERAKGTTLPGTNSKVNFFFYVPGLVYSLAPSPGTYTPTAQMYQQSQNTVFTLIQDMLEDGTLKIEFIQQVTGGLGEETVDNSIDTWADVTLRELQSAVFESQCQFGQLNRITDLFSGVELNGARLLPQINLYPDSALYPSGAQSSTFRSTYSKLWADEGNVQKWRNLIITYKGLDEEQKEKDFTLQRQVNADGTQDYNMSDNWLFKNLVWSSEAIADYADAMVSKMRDVTWFPFEMWGAGLPYLETGDEIEITVNQSTYTSYVLQRQLKGIQNLQDTLINGNLDIF